jgi:purine nucleosidase
MAARGIVPSLLALSVILVLGACAEPSVAAPEARSRVLLDTDANNELDDQHAIAYLLFNGNVFDVEGITVNRTSTGGGIDNHVAEAERIVKLSGLDGRIPVVKGADGSMEEIMDHLHSPDHDAAAAVDFIIRKAHEPSDRKLVLLPVGKLTNIALALKKDPSIAPRVKILWLGSNYPEPGEHNQVNDEPALNFILDSDVEFEIAIVRYGEPSGTDAVWASLAEIRERMPGKGPEIAPSVTGRHGGEFTTFGDYSVSLFENYPMQGDPASRPLFDMAAVAILKNPGWASPRTLPAPILVDGAWVDRPDNPRRIVLWEDFDREAIIGDFFHTVENPVLVQ